MGLVLNAITGLLLVSIPITIIGNVVVILVILRLKRVTTHYILLNIASVDLLSGLLAQPIMLLNLTYWNSSFHEKYNYLCKIFGTISATIAYVSFLTVAGIALDRCLAVKLKQRYRVVVTRENMLLFIAIIWIFAVSMVYPVPKIICSTFHFEYNPNRRMCIAADHIPPNYNTTTTTHLAPVPRWLTANHATDEGCKKAVAFVEAIAVIITPVFVVLVTSTVLIVSLKRRLCQSNVVLRSAQTVVIMTIGFNLCVLPYSATVGISPATIGPSGMLTLIFLMHIHSLINPIIYLTRCSKFRNQLVILVGDAVLSVKRLTQSNRKKIGEADTHDSNNNERDV